VVVAAATFTPAGVNTYSPAFAMGTPPKLTAPDNTAPEVERATRAALMLFVVEPAAILTWSAEVRSGLLL